MKNIIILILMSCFAVACSFEYKHEFTQAQLQKRLDAKMPITKKKGFLTLVISQPIVSLLKETNEIAIKANIEITAKALRKMKSTGYINLKGGIRYDQQSYSFHLNDPNVDFHLDKLSSGSMKAVKKIIEPLIEKSLSSKPIAKLKDGKTKHKLTRAVLKSLSVEGDKVVAVLGMP